MESSFILYKGCWLNRYPAYCSRCMTTAESFQLLNIRNVYEWDCDHEASFWFVIKDSFRGMEELSFKMRNQVKKSLKTYDVNRVSANEMLQVGFPIFQSALDNYRVKAHRITMEAFKDRIVKCEKVGNVDFLCV